MSDVDPVAVRSEATFEVTRHLGMVVLTATETDEDGDLVSYVFDPLDAALLAAALFDKAEQQEDDQ